MNPQNATRCGVDECRSTTSATERPVARATSSRSGPSYVTGTSTTQFPIHGGRNNEGRLTIDGINIGNPPGGNQPPAYIADVGNAAEVTFVTAGGLGEAETGGLTMNIVPRTGGNRISGSVFFSATRNVR